MGWQHLRDNPAARRRVRKKWFEYQMGRHSQAFIDAIFTPCPLYEFLSTPGAMDDFLSERKVSDGVS